MPIGKYLEYHILSKNYYSNENIDKYDAIIVLGGDERRISHAIKLQKKNKDSKLIFLGGSRYLFADKSQNEGNRFKFWAYDIDKDSVIILNGSRNTIENFKEFKPLQKKKNFKNIILVTSPSHYNRSLKIAKKLNLDLYPYMWPKENKPKNIVQYYQSFDVARNLSQFNRFFREVIGYLVVLFI